jgi:hypothetical protein
VQPCASGGFFVTSLLDSKPEQKKEPLPAPVAGTQPALPDENLAETKEEEVKGAKHPPDISKHDNLKGTTALTVLEQEELLSALTDRKRGKNKITCNTRVVHGF